MTDIIKAIQKINPNAEATVTDNDINKITWHNGTTPIPKADIEAMIPTVEQELKDAETNAETKKASGKQKLKDLGLDDDEIQALIGV
ncbi:hypothetical protein ACIJYB_04000 [Candidatus Pelagibacter bacterium nBUS_44]|uniref:hypothetical protein n=1 Tax=Candidatus Pelagibacter bacterium nBUS_44 TaxID=3374195 RepID=UPI003EBD9E57